ncbi:Nucleotide-binding universal stress protein, UspA family [Paucidesulfovibrio gracilis DSM 16080]|uniref:Nucleotide-binding universal stress protein, UspA family n=1 Tax=Paucidesulfovibrio gracilis DSM 16080 TaxID=1121449 RepID=A0A1T4XXV5_9BACT|nr:universal stress protein [Paucidesulfovibrio gracilis]SKA94354.1 Nucleotide-binding universal stress protein, UspA family [Paucidesulfovibrio gracilis DSM 16080]
MQIKTLLLPVDGSPCSDRAVNYALGFCELVQARLVLLHVHKAVPQTLGKPNFDEAMDRLRKEAQDVLQPYEDMLAETAVEYESRIVSGPTAEVIFDVAKAESCDLIIMGSKGKSDLEGLMVGSVTHKVLHVAPCPVLVIH